MMVIKKKQGYFLQTLSLGCNSGLLLHLTSLLSALLLPSLQAACSAADFHLFRVFCPPPSGVHSAGFFFNSVSQLWNPASPPWRAVHPHSPTVVSLVSPSLSCPLTARILQAGRLLPDHAKAPGGENSPGWALPLQYGFSAWGLTEKVLDYKLDGDAAILLLRPFFVLDPHALAVMLVWRGPKSRTLALVKLHGQQAQWPNQLWIVLRFLF